ncbi:mannitol dehydrogenase family protein [Pseudaestuariivita atlantica]|uniref:Mannitol dehydrogenase n=1 Tax=Pseudaestuariivita atlantica TaxID=1317121 RepID=A0A0L1JTD0_9RHOB|nr:mannitol dehydrogenase family protein [Pseudaestuariivita atlantica]KNG94942.1 mannitol dehydrogenase [Pseudaestuariivita atlantica]
MDELIPLRLSTLGALPQGVLVPTYDRARLSPGIVHVGLGNFHRAHQAWYLHRLMQAGEAMDWAIIGAGVRPYDSAMRDRLLAQDCLTTLIELDPARTAVEVTGAMIDYLPVEPDNGALIAQIADPSTRIVSMTVTEGGYYNGPHGFDIDHADLRADIATPDRPRTVFGAIVAALGLRHAAGHGPITLLSCDNLQNNGDILRNAVVTLAQATDPALAKWIDRSCSFPNSMVDCIVPATGPTELDLVHGLGIDDKAPVTHEAFRHWVIEDKFCAGRPAWDKVGAIMTDDVHVFEAMKLRILNGGHQIVANAGELLSVGTISDATADPTIGALFDKVEAEEILPQVAPVPGFTPEAYLDLIRARFLNPRIVDTTRRVAFDGSSRHPGFLLPSLRDRLASGQPAPGLALVEALWARYCVGTREDGTTIEPNDPMWDRLQPQARAAQSDPMVWLQMDDIYGPLAQNPEFRAAFADAVIAVRDLGVVGAIEAYCHGARTPRASAS